MSHLKDLKLRGGIGKPKHVRTHYASSFLIKHSSPATHTLVLRVVYATATSADCDWTPSRSLHCPSPLNCRDTVLSVWDQPVLSTCFHRPNTGTPVWTRWRGPSRIRKGRSSTGSLESGTRRFSVETHLQPRASGEQVGFSNTCAPV